MYLKSVDSFKSNVGIFYVINDGVTTVNDVKAKIGKCITIDSKEFLVKGVESFAMGEPVRGEQTRFSILV